MTARPVSTDDELQADMEAARLSYENWLADRRHGYRRQSQYAPDRTEEDDRLDDPRHGQAADINRGR